MMEGSAWRAEMLGGGGGGTDSADCLRHSGRCMRCVCLAAHCP